MGKQRFENKTNYDPGRFRYNVAFKKQESVPDGSGGTKVQLTDLITTKAVREEITRRVSLYGTLTTPAGDTVKTSDYYFIIRHRASFYPTKDMVLICNGDTYAINDIIEIDVPVNYIKVLCIKSA